MRIINETEKYQFVEFEPQVRSFLYKHSNYPKQLIRSAFPYLQVLKTKPTKSVPSFYITCSTKPAEKNADLCCVPLPNIYESHAVCLKKRFKGMTMDDFVELFWNSSFTDVLGENMRVFKEINGITSKRPAILTPSNFYEYLTIYWPPEMKLDEVLNKTYQPILKLTPLFKKRLKESFGEIPESNKKIQN